MRLLLVRHGQTPANVAGSLDTTLPGPGLTDLGTRQAQAVPEALAAEPVDAVFASPATRAQATAAPLAAARGLAVQVIDGLQEIQAGDVEKRTDEASVRTYLDTMSAWCHGDLELPMPGAETGAQLVARGDAGIAAVAATGAQCAVVVSHGAFIRVWTTIRAGNLGPGFAGNNALGNTGIVELEGDPAGGWVALRWMGEPLGGPGVDDQDPFDGPTGRPLD
ncbi:histidine phosphatase family protein [Dermacoccaceae bacterium W4C1]